MPDMRVLVGRELDAAVAERVMGWRDIHLSRLRSMGKQLIGKPNNTFEDVPPYSSDDNAARLARNRIAELGLEERFEYELCRLIGYYGRHPGFTMLQSTAEQQCRAALAAVDATNQDQQDGK